MIIDSVWLGLVFGAGNREVKKLIEKYKSAECIRAAVQNGEISLSAKYGDIVGTADYEADRIVRLCNENGIKIIAIGSNEYPRLLYEIENPPAVLYALGNTLLLNTTPCACIVGTRRCTDIGAKSAFAISARLSLAGFTIVSGGADGIDTAAHCGSMLLYGKTVCVMPSGILSGYRNDKSDFRKSIIDKGGCILSEYPPESTGSKGVFHLRNRLLSGLSLCTVVAEAPERSGASITATHAAEQGRDVFAVDYGDVSTAGCAALIDDGANKLTDVRVIIDAYLNEYPSLNKDKAFCGLADGIIKNAYEIYKFSDTLKKLNSFSDRTKKGIRSDVTTKKTRTKTRRGISELSADAQKLLKSIKQEFFSPDYLDVTDDDLDNGVYMALFELEKAGYIEASPSGLYRLADI